MAIKVLGRRKFFTFISLFGISFTLMILMLITSFLDAELGNHAPLTDKDRMVFLSRVSMRLVVEDTVRQIDTVMMDGSPVYDTTLTFNDRTRSSSSSSGSYTFFDRYLRDVQGAAHTSIYSPGHTYDLFVKSRKLTFDVIYADHTFWSIFDFNFDEGRAFQKSQVDNQEQVAVITSKAAEEYFGAGAPVLGEDLQLGDKNFKVIGVVEDLGSSKRYLDAEVYLPLTNINNRQLTDLDFLGPFEAVFFAAKPDDRRTIKKEIVRRAGQIQMPSPDEYNKLVLTPMTFMERYSRSVIYDEDPKKSVRTVLSVLMGLLLLFILLPTLNLINLNISRILERSSEIGVRKAFGAHSSSILFQFVFENVILTFLGGFIGLILALILLRQINSSNVFPDTVLQFNVQVFLYSILICLFFGILSGLIPAYRMSRVHIVNALKQNQA